MPFQKELLAFPITPLKGGVGDSHLLRAAARGQAGSACAAQSGKPALPDDGFG